MIYSVFSDLKTFKSIKFHKGLNVLLAHKTIKSTDKQTRNGSGKSSLIEIIHFIFGSKCPPDSIFRTNELALYNFGIEFDLKNHKTSIERNGLNHNLISALSGDFDSWPNNPLYNRKTQIHALTINAWLEVLNYLIFEVRNDKESKEKYAPSFRSLFSYFVRRQNSNAFYTHEKINNDQQLWDQQVSITYLLGLDWTIPQQLQALREKEKILKELKKAAKDDTFNKIIGTSSDLLTELTIGEGRLIKKKERIESFHVLPDYHELEDEATKITSEISVLSDENTLDKQTIIQIEDALNNEEAPDYTRLESLYYEAGVVLPDSVVKRFNEVKDFHDTIISNRRTYLTSELNEAEQRIALCNDKMDILSKRRSEIMQVLKSHGALDHYIKLQSEINKLEAEVENIRNRYNAASELENVKSETEIERKRIHMRLATNYKEQANVLKNAIIAFEEISKELYEKAGSLTINPTNNGPEFDIKMQGIKSKGIKNMQIFCFDMMIMKLSSERGIGPGFLIHDSHLFDGVDERQVSKALQIGAKLSEKYNFQYIVTMNSDTIPRTFDKDFNIENYILPTVLTDETDTGGLLGIRLNNY